MGWFIKRLGPKAALFIQTAGPAVRILIQVIGALVGGRSGIIIFQLSQLIGIIGGPAGYMWVVLPPFECTLPALRAPVADPQNEPLKASPQYLDERACGGG